MTHINFLASISVSIEVHSPTPACHKAISRVENAGEQGSTPWRGVLLFKMPKTTKDYFMRNKKSRHVCWSKLSSLIKNIVSWHCKTRYIPFFYLVWRDLVRFEFPVHEYCMHFIVEAVFDCRSHNGSCRKNLVSGREFFVKWKGYVWFAQLNTWEPLSELRTNIALHRFLD